MSVGDFTIVSRSLRARLFSTGVTAAMVAVAVALLTVLLSLREAASTAFRRDVGNVHLLVSAEPSPLESVLNGLFYANAPRNPLPHAEFERIAASFPFEYAIPNAQGDSFFGYPVLATTRDFFTKLEPREGQPWVFQRGTPFSAPFEVVLGSVPAAASGATIGQTLHLSHGAPGDRAAHEHRDFAFTVVGILEPSGTPHDRAVFIDLESTWILHAHDRRVAELGPGAGPTTAEHLLPEDRRITGVYLRVPTRAGQQLGSVLPQVYAALRADPRFTVVNPRTEVDRLFAIVGSVDQLFYAMAAAVLVSSALSIMLALYNQMEQRRRQIAVLRVLGASRGRVFALVLTESAVIGLVGAGFGALLAAAGMVAASAVLARELGLRLDATVDPKSAVVIVAAAVALCALAGLVPAVAGYRTSVVRNLRPAA